jgi:endonuclease/exonuclease/phosphatase family metal-dependent hydrolase
MKIIQLSFIAVCLIISHVGTAAELSALGSNLAGNVRVMSFNIRYNNPDDGDYAWPNRKEMVASVVNFHGADLVGMQEVLRGQLTELETLLPDYAWYGVGRNNGATTVGSNGQSTGEFAPVFYRKDRFQLLDSGEFWLSETPNAIASRGWDAALPRIATWVKFKDRQSGRDFIHLNTHFDHRGEVAQVRSAQLIIDQLKVLSSGLPVVVTGDFNVTPGSDAYATMIGDLADTKLESQSLPHGPDGTFGGFTVELGESTDRIDYVFVGGGFKVLRYGVLSDQWNGRYPSDHLPVLAEIQL